MKLYSQNQKRKEVNIEEPIVIRDQIGQDLIVYDITFYFII